MKTKQVLTVEGDYEWAGWEATLRDDDSLVVEYWSRIQGNRTGGRYQWAKTGLLAAIAAADENEDEDADAEEMVADWVERRDADSGKCLRRGRVVE